MSDCPACRNNNTLEILSFDSTKIYKCTNCRLIFSYPLPFDEDLQKYYQGFLFEKPNLTRIPKKIRTKTSELKDLFKFGNENLENKTFLDYGGGTGVATEAARRLGLKINYFDLDAQAIAFVKETFNIGDTHFYTEDELVGKKFDYVLSDNVIEHVKDPEAFIRKLYSMLNDDGRLVIKTPNVSNNEILFTWAILVFQYFVKALKYNGLFKTAKATFVHKYWHCSPPRHLYGFSKNSLENIIAQIDEIEHNDIKFKHYSLPFGKFNLLSIAFAQSGIFRKIIFFILLLPFAVIELPIILLRYVLAKMNLISKVGLVLEINKIK